MKAEIEAAARFLTQLISSNQPRNLSDNQLQQFKSQLEQLFEDRFQGHWFPAHPNRGQAYRCIRLNKKSCADPIINQAAIGIGLEYTDLRLPVELTLWVDPQEVSCRFGEHEGSYCTVASFNNDSDPDCKVNEERSAVSPVAIPKEEKPPVVKSSPSSPNIRVSPTSSVPVHYRLSNFYPNYKSPPKGWYHPTTSSQYYHVPTSKSTNHYGMSWGLAYVPNVRFLNNWPMGQMVKV